MLIFFFFWKYLWRRNRNFEVNGSLIVTLTGSFDERRTTTKRPPFAVRCVLRSSEPPTRRLRSSLWAGTGKAFVYWTRCPSRPGHNSMASALGVLKPRLPPPPSSTLPSRGAISLASPSKFREAKQGTSLSLLPSLSLFLGLAMEIDRVMASKFRSW